MMIRLLLLALLCWMAATADTLAFDGMPAVRIDTDGHESKRTDLSEADAAKYECRIVKKRRGGYLWASRANRELKRIDAGDYLYFVSPEGSGYVKVYTGSEPQNFDYLEHLSTELKTITYWGKRAGGQMDSSEK